ncbi:MAG TPA: cytochrome c maturation protein CcmE [Cytophagales bacterium]|nr:cytochrome c maturation protein CcmE [Cytophagales bacterium]
MKLPQIILLVAIAIGIGIIVSVSFDVSTYCTFKEAKEKAAQNDKTEVHVVGTLIKDQRGYIQGMYYDPRIDPNYFSFLLRDSLNNEMTVIYSSPKPADFDRSDKVVVIGKVQEGKFIASKILLKCPSKYNDKEIKESYYRKEDTIEPELASK